MKPVAIFVLLLYVDVGEAVKWPIAREACTALPAFAITSLTSGADLKISCEDTFGGRGIIAIRQVFHGQASSCSEDVRKWTCARDTTDTSENILNANGKGSFVTSVSPKLIGWCPEQSNHVFVRYTCHDEPRDVCEQFELSTRKPFDLVTPGYPHPSPDYGFVPGITCACNVTVRDNAKIEANVIDLDLLWGRMGTCAEEILNGSLEDHEDIWDIIYYTHGACTPTDLPRNITLPKSTWTFIYSRQDNYVTRPRRGAWFALRGLSADNQPVNMKLKCAVLPDVRDPPNAGSGQVSTNSGTAHSESVFHATEPFTSSTAPSPSPAGAEPRSYIGVIVGAAMGGFLVLALFAVVVFICLRRKNAHGCQDAESKLARIPPAVPPLPVRNSPHKVSLASRTSSCPEYFEPIGEEIYCVPEDVQNEAAKYAVLEGVVNPSHDYLNPSGLVTASTYENKRKLTKEVSVVSGDYAAVDEFSDYENTRISQEQKNAEYCHLPPEGEQATKAEDYEKLAVGNEKT